MVRVTAAFWTCLLLRRKTTSTCLEALASLHASGCNTAGTRCSVVCVHQRKKTPAKARGRGGEQDSARDCLSKEVGQSPWRNHGGRGARERKKLSEKAGKEKRRVELTRVGPIVSNHPPTCVDASANGRVLHDGDELLFRDHPVLIRVELVDHRLQLIVGELLSELARDTS